MVSGEGKKSKIKNQKAKLQLKIQNGLCHVGFGGGFLCSGKFFSIVFKVFHPIGPNGKGGVEVVFAMPLERPQLLNADFPDGEIHEKAVYITIVSVNTEISHSFN